MGNAGHLHYAGAFAALVLLSGCERAASQTQVDETVRAQINAQVVPMRVKIGELESKLKAIEGEQAVQARYLTSVGRTANAVSDLASKNARIANENAVKDMTRRGACGQERINYPNGGYVIQNRECTIKDLSR